MIPEADLQRRMATLPAIPSSVVRLSALARDGNASVTEFEHVIKPDVALTANLLRLANSSLFGLRSRVCSVRHAVLVLGTTRLQEMAIAAAYLPLIPSCLHGYRVLAADFWTHGVAVATLAERLAAAANSEPPCLTFTAGLLHDVGKLVIGYYLQSQAQSVVDQLATDERCLLEVEQETLSTDHTRVGAQLAERWGFPAAIVASARWHHDPPSAEAECQRIAGLVHVADAVAHLLGFGADIGGLQRRLNEGALDGLGLEASAVERVASDSLMAIQELAQLFNHRGRS